jgi:hypothetical protein
MQLSALPRRTSSVLLASLALVFTSSCNEPVAPTPVPQGNQVVNVNVNVGTVAPSPNPSPSAGPGGCTPGVVEFVRVGPFGYDGCPGAPPANSSGLLPAGCVAHVTATPKDRNGLDVPASLHGTQVVWSVVVGSDRITVTEDPTQNFNRNVQKTPSSAPGEFSLQATVCGVTGAWNGRTTL